jgi:hypothetical protein
VGGPEEEEGPVVVVETAEATLGEALGLEADALGLEADALGLEADALGLLRWFDLVFAIVNVGGGIVPLRVQNEDVENMPV